MFGGFDHQQSSFHGQYVGAARQMLVSLERYAAVEQLIDDAWEMSRQLDLGLVKLLLEMAKLELYEEMQAEIGSNEIKRSERRTGARRQLQ
jgi:thioredoxin-like negative regulator of GroEL